MGQLRHTFWKAGLLLTVLAVEPAGRASPWTEGQKRLLFIRVDFSDLPGAPFADATGTNLISSLNNFYTEMSYGRTSFALAGAGSEVTPTLRMPQPGAKYGTNNLYNQLRSDARNAAAAAGYVLTNYDLDVTCMTNVPGWSWSGLSFVGTSGAWLRNSFNTGAAAHELGHNYGLNHANFWNTSGQSVIGPGTSVEQGDYFDTMGWALAGNNHFNAHCKYYLNWLTTNDVAIVTNSGTYRIAALDDPASSGLRALSIAKNSSTNYWVEFRQKPINRWVTNGALLHWAQSGNQRTYLLDTTPGSADGENDSALVIGRTFSDAQAGVYLTPIGKGGTTPESLDVVVNLGSFPGNSPPTVSLTANGTNVAIGTSLNFSATAGDANGDALAYYWDFGDGTFGTNGPVASKSWSATGEYVVRCLVSDLKGGLASDSLIVQVGLPATYRITGLITFGGNPLVNARVYASSSKMTYTDSDGTYHLIGLSAGSYVLGVSLYGYNFSPSGFSNSIVVGPSATNINFLAAASAGAYPAIAWSNPADIVYGTALGASQLNATASYNSTTVSGTFTYSPPAGTALVAGANQTLSVTFTPTNSTGLLPVTTNVTINVQKAALIIWANSRNKTCGQAVTFAGTEFTSSGLVNGSSVASVTITSAGVAATAAVGTYTITLSVAVGTDLSNYAISYADGTLTVNPSLTSGSIASSANPALPGANVTFTHSLSAVAPGAGTPSGTVNFRIDGSVAGSSTLSGSAASFSTTTLSHGSHVVMAEYPGDSNFVGSTNRLTPDQVINTPLTITKLPDHGGFSITGSGIPGRTYRMQYTDSLTPANWLDLAGGSVTADSNGMFQFVDTTSATTRFYRSAYP